MNGNAGGSSLSEETVTPPRLRLLQASGADTPEDLKPVKVVAQVTYVSSQNKVKVARAVSTLQGDERNPRLKLRSDTI